MCTQRNIIEQNDKNQIQQMFIESEDFKKVLSS